MKTANAILVIILLVILAGCGGKVEQSTDDFITVDVTKKYPIKKELILQDFMDVEYIPLETNDDFVNQGVVMDIGEHFIIVKNRGMNGDVFIYDRNGNALQKFNHVGQGPGEYTPFCLYGGIKLDEDNNEIILNAYILRKFIVYDLSGNFKRSFQQNVRYNTLINSTSNTYSYRSYYSEIFNYDKENLICYDIYNHGIAYDFISKRDGSITKEIQIPFLEKLLIMHRDAEAAPGIPAFALIPNKDNWLLSEISSDTIYTLLSDYSLSPFIVRTPSIQSMDPKIFLLLRLMSDRYYFMETVRLNTVQDYPRTFIMYDTQEKAFSGYTLYNSDYSTNKEIYLNLFTPLNHDIVSWWQKIEASQLVESYKKGELKDGKLKEIAAKLDPDDNPVIMLITHKK